MHKTILPVTTYPLSTPDKSRPNSNFGFTIIEVLVTLVLLASLMVAGGYFISHILLNSKIGLRQKAVDEWGRIDYLLETDIREAAMAASGSIPLGKSCLSSPSNPALGLITPYGSASAIAYYNSTINGRLVIRRCGPDILADGSLSPTSASDNILIYDAEIEAQTQDNLFVEYSLQLNGAPSTETGSARLRSRS